MTRTIPQPPYDVRYPADAIATALSIFACVAEDVRRIADAADRPAAGPCGHKIPSVGGRGMLVCDLPADHTGAHQESGGASWQTEVSSRGGETAPRGDGGTGAGSPESSTNPSDRHGHGGASHEDVSPDVGTTSSVRERAVVTPTPLQRLREVALRARERRTLPVVHQYPMPISDPGAFVGEHTKFVVILPSLLVALLDVVESAEAAEKLWVECVCDDTDCPYARVFAALARLREVAP